MIVLGLNGWTERGHDGGASLIIDGKLDFAIEEERLIGQRHAYDTIPNESIKACLKHANITLDEVDLIVIGWDYEKLYHMLNREFISKEEVSKAIFKTEKYASKIKYLTHHLAHAYSTFIPSNYEEALVLVLDGQGEYMGTSMYFGNRSKKTMELLMETTVSLGYFYSGITEHIGFKGGEEGKTMGLAAYGEPIYKDLLNKYIYINEEGNLECIFKIEKTSKDEEDATIEKWLELLNNILPKREGKIVSITEDIVPYANLAQSAQKLLEELVISLVKKYSNQTKVRNVCIAGGVGLNCPMSSAVENLDEIDKVFVQPAANDGGISLGAAIKGSLDLGDTVKIEMIPYTGCSYLKEDIINTLKDKKYNYTIHEDIEKVIAQLINNDCIVANYQGRMELGPRALGNRSLLASPKKYEMLIKMNNLKGREVWRPLAPAVLFDRQEEVFDSNVFSPHMTKNVKVLKEKQADYQAITHVDGTARIQSVTKEYNLRFYKIIEEFYKLSGLPVVINTSFNVKGEPIVCTPLEAIESFEKMNLDYLVLDKYLIKRKD